MKAYCFAVLMFILLLPALCVGATINATSCSRADVSAAIDSAAENDTVLIPAGSCTWTTQLSISKAITLAGSGIGVTNITDGVSKTVTGALRSPLKFVTETGKFYRATNFTMLGGANDPQLNGTIVMGGVSRTTRIDHMRFANILTRSVQYGGGAVGVVDHCTFDLDVSPGSFQAFLVRLDNWNGGLYGDNSWADADQVGSANALYIEDNTFNGNDARSIADGYAGARIVVRYNTSTNMTFNVHGLDSSGRTRSNRLMEMYGNVMSMACCGYSNTMAEIRGGMGFVFNNTLTGLYTAPARATTFRSDPGYGNTPFGSCACSGTLASCLGDWDGNTVLNEPGSGYPCLDQAGRGQDDGLVSVAVPPVGWPNQQLSPMYGWNNTVNGVVPATLQIRSPDDVIVENRDFYNQTSTFDGTVGMGVGTLASRPATCTTGVGYWATDQGEWNSVSAGNDGQLYKCTAPNTWTLYYKPYTYPHPLVSGEVPELQTDFIGHWKLDETSGTTAADELALNPGTLVNLDASVAHVVGNAGRAIACDSDGYVNIPDDASLDIVADQDFTAMVRVKTTTSMQPSQYPVLFGKSDTDGTRDEWAIFRAGSTDGCTPTACQAYFQVFIAGSGQGCNSKTAFNDGKWHHLAFTREGSTVRCYQDGVFLSQNTAAVQSGSLVNASPVRLCHVDGGAYAPGVSVDDARLYDRALSQSEIAVIAAEGDTPKSGGASGKSSNMGLLKWGQ